MNKKFSLNEILEQDTFFRRNFINSITGFKSVALIGTAEVNGKENLAPFNSLVHIGATPPLLGFIMRPVSVPRHTYQNIKQSGQYTVNHIHESFYRQAHQAAARYEGSEFEATGLSPEYFEDFKAPFVKEAEIKIGLKLEEEIHIKSNDTILIIGAIQAIYINSSLVRQDGFVDLEQSGTIAIAGLDAYYKPKALERLSYPKRGKTLSAI